MPPPPYEQRKRRKLTNSNGDLRRDQLIEWCKDGHWFTVTEAAKALKVNRHQARWYIYELRDRGFLKEQRRHTGKPSKTPMEYSYEDNWPEIIGNPHPVVQKHVKRLKHLAEVYRAGRIPTGDSVDEVLTEIGDEIEQLDELRRVLSIIYENKDLRRINPFVKRMSSDS